MNTLSRSVILMGLLWMGASLVSAEMYRWRERDGQLHYSTSPPSYAVEYIEVKRKNQWHPYKVDETSGTGTDLTTAPITYTTSVPAVDSPDRNASRQNLAQTIVPYNSRNSSIIIPITLHDRLTESFVVDTGASITMIFPEVAQELGLSSSSRLPLLTIHTANGTVQAPLVHIKKLTIGGLTTTHVSAVIHRFDDVSGVKGLLGLNVLNRFQMTVDAPSHQLIFTSQHPLDNYADELDCIAAREWLRRARAMDDGTSEKITCYQQALLLCPDIAEAYYELGAIYIRQQNSQQAIALHRQLVRRRPDDAEAHYRLGVSYMLERNFTDACREFQKTLQLNPDHQQAQEYLCRLTDSS